MARWDKIVEYYSALEKQSGGRMKVINMGPTAMGNPFLMVIVTSPANFAKLERLRQVHPPLSDPRRLTGAQARALADERKTLVGPPSNLPQTPLPPLRPAPQLALLAR